MRAPDFWFKSGDWRTVLLQPIAALYGRIAAWRLMQKGARAVVPVICIGNFTAGGTGKTPTAIAIATMLREMGETPVFLTRGYGGAIKGPCRVDPRTHDAAMVGDEALLLAHNAPVIKSADRVAGAAFAAELGSVIVMDDGLQNPSLMKNFTIAVVDAETGLGNGQCIPAGPLRAPFDAQLRVTDAVLLMGHGDAETSLTPRLGTHAVWHATLVPDAAVIVQLRGQNVFAFAGIGRPDKFFDMLTREGVQVKERRSFADHEPFSLATLQQMAQLCQREKLIPVTTEKDAMRMGEKGRAIFSASPLIVVPVQFKSPEEDAIRHALSATLTHCRN